ncbi:unnamed protein product, partial [Auanema sp. JU1783]
MWLRMSAAPALIMLLCISSLEAGWLEPYPNCGRCLKTTEDVHLDVLRTLNVLESAVRKTCRIHSDTDSINDQLFDNKTNTTNTLACIYMLDLCEQKTDRGQKVPEGQWSCQVCEEALNLIV